MDLSGKTVTLAAGGTGYGKVLQVVEGGLEGTSVHAAGGSTWDGVSSATLTNVGANSIVIGFLKLSGYNSSTGSDMGARIVQGARTVGGGTASNNDSSSSFVNFRIGAGASVYTDFNLSTHFYDDGHSGGTVTYSLQVITEGTMTIGRGTQSGQTRFGRPETKFLLMEIAG